MGLFRRKVPAIPEEAEIEWEKLREACSYFILPYLRDREMPRVVYYHPEDFKYNRVLNDYAQSRGFGDLPQPYLEERFVREGEAGEQSPRCFPDRQKLSDPALAEFKAELVHGVFVANLVLMDRVAEEWSVGFCPDRKLGELLPNHVYFVRYGYRTFYQYWSSSLHTARYFLACWYPTSYQYCSLTDQEDDPPMLRGHLKADAVLSQFPSWERIEWWMEVFAFLRKAKVVPGPRELFATYNHPLPADKFPQIAQIPAELARKVISSLTACALSPETLDFQGVERKKRGWTNFSKNF